MASPKTSPVGYLSGIARPSVALKARLGGLGYDPRTIAKMDAVLDDVHAVETLAQLIKERVEVHATTDGRVDYRDVAADILAVLRANQKG